MYEKICACKLENCTRTSGGCFENVPGPINKETRSIDASLTGIRNLGLPTQPMHFP